MSGEREKWLIKAKEDEAAAKILVAANGPRSLIAYHFAAVR